MECVEEKMGMQLHTERLKFGVGQPRLQLKCFAIAFLRPPIIIQRMNDADDDPIYRKIYPGLDQRVAQKARTWSAGRWWHLAIWWHILGP